MAEVRDKATPMISRPSVKKYRSRASWLFDRGASSSMEKDKQPILRVEDVDQDSSPAPPRGEGSRQNGLLLQMPERQQGPFTMSQAKTPGWDSPWVPHNFKLPPSDDAQVDSRSRDLSDSGMNMGGSRGSSTRLGKWAKRRKNIRSCVLHHNYVPLVCRAALVILSKH